jgi:hypothetical protein
MNRPWIAFSPDITDEDALKRVAHKLRVSVKLLELTRTGGAVLVRLRDSLEKGEKT